MEEDAGEYGYEPNNERGNKPGCNAGDLQSICEQYRQYERNKCSDERDATSKRRDVFDGHFKDEW